MVYSFPHDGASVLACAYQLKVRSQNPKDFEHLFSQRLWVKFAMFLLITSFCLFLVRYKHASENARYLGVFVCGSVLQAFDVEVLGIDFYTFAFVLVDKLYSSFIT